MRDYRRSRDLLSRNERDELKRLTRTKAQLTKELGREPEDLEVARSAGMGLSCYRQAIASLTRTAEQLDEIQDLSRSPEMVALVRRDHARLSGYIDELPERLRRILRCYYVHDRSFAWIATRLHLSEVRVCQLHGEAIRLLRRKCGPRKVLQTVRPR
jgi:RNA polymerase sigma factor for flagellar operon FliA